MKKDIEWLKEEIGELPCVDTVFNSGGSSYIDSAVPVMTVYDLINELDEPEALSQEWIDKKRLINRVENYIPLHDKTVGDVINGILEIIKQLPELEVLSPEWIDENQHPYGGDYHVPSEKLEDILVPKQEELEVKIQKLIETYKQEEGAYSNRENGWISGFVEDLKNLVEEEQKYYLKIGNLYLAEPLGDMTSDIVRMTRDKGVAYQFTDKKSIATHLEKLEGIEAVKVEELEE